MTTTQPKKKRGATAWVQATVRVNLSGIRKTKLDQIISDDRETDPTVSITSVVGDGIDALYEKKYGKN